MTFARINNISSVSESSKAPKLLTQTELEQIEVPGGTGLKILLVDDTPTITKMTSLMLRKLGYNVTPAENGQLAINLVVDKWKKFGEKYDVILMDLQMPVMDGLEATRRLRQLEQPIDGDTLALPKNTILGVSANSDDETVAEAVSAGVDGFLSKPFNAAALLSTLEKCKSCRS
jgi:CheY-like chemotaxis protein